MSDADTTLSAPDSTTPPARGRFISFAIIFTIFFFVAMFVLLYHDWVKGREPAFEVVVAGTEYHNGAQITIEGADPNVRYTATLGDRARMEIPFYLEPGSYVLTIVFQGKKIEDRQIDLAANDDHRVWRLTMVPPAATTMPGLPASAQQRQTMNSRPLVIMAEGSAAAPLGWLRERADVVEAKHGSPEFSAALAHADGLIVRTYTKVDDALLVGAPKLRVVGRGGVGLENIDVAAARRRGVEVVFTPDANTLAVGDFVIGCMIRLLRPFAEFHERTYAPTEFKRLRDTLRGRQLNELTLGILGLGRVGKRVAHIAANGLGMRVIYNDVIDQQASYTSVDKPTLYRQADVLSLHVDMRAAGNEHLVAAQQLSLMKPTSILINTSRGEVLDAAALADAIREKRLAGAAIDVFDPEPPPPDFPLLGLENVLLTPHMAARTHTAIDNMSWVVRDVINVIEGRSPQFPAPRNRA